MPKNIMLDDLLENTGMQEEIASAIYAAHGIEVRFSTKGNTLHVYYTNGLYGDRKFCIRQMPGQCGALVVFGIPLEYYHKNYCAPMWDDLSTISEYLMFEIGYGLLLMSHNDIKVINHFENECDWQYASDFYNPHSGNNVWVISFRGG